MQDLPRTCPCCGHDLTEHPYYRLVPGRAARILRRVGLWLLPVMAVVYLYILVGTPAPMGFGTGAGYFAVLMIGGPSLVLYLISRLLPRPRDVICLHCSWHREYPPAAHGVST